MNRNTILAFLLILATVSFFSSKFYYEKILKQPHPSDKPAVTRQKEVERPEELREPSKKESAEEEAQHIEKKDDTEQKEDVPEVSGVDTFLEYDTIWIETEKLIVGISELGGRIISVQTKQYRQDPIATEKSLEENPYVELVAEPEIGGANLRINDRNLDKKAFLLQSEEENYRIEGTDSLFLEFLWNGGNGEAIIKRYSFKGSDYTVGLTVHSDVLDGKKVGVGWLAGIRESEENHGGKSAQYDVRKVHLFDGKNVSHISEKKPNKGEESGYYKWVALTSKYFLVAMINDSVRDADVSIEAFIEKPEEGKDNGKKKQKVINYRVITQRFANGQNEKYSFYMGPASLDELKAKEIDPSKVLFGGWKWFFRADLWFPALCEFVLWLLISLQKVLQDYGLVILALTVLSRLITYPLTHSSMKSMARMRELQPKVSAIREKHKSNPQKMNQKMMELYKKEGVNPLNPGCLPMFLQMPVFISLFIVLRKSIELRGAGTWVIPWVNDLSKPEMLPIPGLNPLPFDIPLYGNNVALLPIVMAVLTYFQNKATIKDPNQKAMIYFMPIFMLVLFNSFPAGLVLYWTFSSALGLVQQFGLEKLKKRGQVGDGPEKQSRR